MSQHFLSPQWGLPRWMFSQRWHARCGALLPICVALGWTLTVVPPSEAQQAAKSAAKPATREDQDWTAYNELKQAVAATQDAAAGAEIYAAFFAAHPTLTPNVAATVVYEQALHHTEKLSQPQEASRMLQEALTKLSSEPKLSAHLKLRLYVGQASALEAQDEVTDALSLLQQPQVYAAMVSAGQGSWEGAQMSATAGVSRVLALLRAQDKASEAAAFLARYFSDAPEMLDEFKQRPDYYSPRGALYNAVVDVLQEQKEKENEAALGWVRLRLMTCDFNAAALARTTPQVSKAFALDDNLAGLQAFLSAQEDASLPNPLAQVPLPALDETRLNARVAVLRRKVSARAPKAEHVHALNSAWIAQGQLGAAMGVARELWLSRLDAPEGAAEVARVFKAGDLSVVRSNAFLAYIKGQGPNPMPAFFEQFPDTRAE